MSAQIKEALNVSVKKRSRWQTIGIPIFNTVLGCIVAINAILLARAWKREVKPLAKEMVRSYFASNQSDIGNVRE